jgi:hypothetical protein
MLRSEALKGIYRKALYRKQASLAKLEPLLRLAAGSKTILLQPQVLRLKGAFTRKNNRKNPLQFLQP